MINLKSGFLFIPAIVFCSASSFASSVCIVSAAEDKTVCDGKTVETFADTTEAFSLELKSLIDKGYKIVSQGGGDKSNFQIWTLVK